MPVQSSRGPWVMLLNNSGQYFPQDPRPGEFSIEQIAHGLSIESRYGSHTPYPYSVAQHSIFVSRWAECLAGSGDAEERLMCAWDGLFHDASEGLGLKDIPTPVKVLLAPLYHSLEDKLMNALASDFKFRWPVVSTVKVADMDVFCTEVLKFFPPETRAAHWNGVGQQVPGGLDLSEWTWREAKERWLVRYHELHTRSALGRIR